MCVFPSAPKMPPPPPLPPPPPPPPQLPDPNIVAARDRNKQVAALASGRSGNTFTSPLGLLTEPSKTKKSLLGE